MSAQLCSVSQHAALVTQAPAAAVLAAVALVTPARPASQAALVFLEVRASGPFNNLFPGRLGWFQKQLSNVLVQKKKRNVFFTNPRHRERTRNDIEAMAKACKLDEALVFPLEFPGNAQTPNCPPLRQLTLPYSLKCLCFFSLSLVTWNILSTYTQIRACQYEHTCVQQATMIDGV